MGQTGSVPSLSNMLIRLELKLVKIASRVRLSLASVPRFPLRAHSPDPQAAESCGGISEEARAAVRKALVRPHVFWSLEVRLSRVSLIGRDESLLQTESQVPTVMRAWVRNHSLAAPPPIGADGNSSCKISVLRARRRLSPLRLPVENTARAERDLLAQAESLHAEYLRGPGT